MLLTASFKSRLAHLIYIYEKQKIAFRGDAATWDNFHEACSLRLTYRKVL